MSRRLVALLLASAVPASAIWAPMLHAHADHLGGHHGAPRVHAHLAGHAHHHQTKSDHPTLNAPDEDGAIYVQTFVAVHAAPFEVPLAPSPGFALPPLRELPAHRAVDVTHGHDPPLASALASRPPPQTVLS